MKPITLILLLIILFYTSTTSQEKTWTLDECMIYAINNSPQVNKQIARNNIHKYNYTEAIGDIIPSISANSGVNFNYGRQADPETNAYNNINTFNNSYGIYSSMNLFNGLSNINNIRMQKVNRLMGKEQLEETKDLIAYETMEAYLNVLYVKEIYTLAELQLEESRNNLRQVIKMEELGIKGSPDVAELAAKEAADNYNLTRQKNELTIAKIRLKEKMNFPLDQKLEIAEYEISQLVQKNEETVSDIFNNALYSYPKLLSAEYELRSNKLSYDISKGYLFPRLNFEAGLSTGFSRRINGENNYDPFRDQLRNRQGYYFGFSISIPILNGFSYSSSVKRGKQQYIIAQNQFDEIKYRIYSEIEQAVADMNGQADAHIQAQKQSEAMQLAHSANQKKYTEGLISAIELTTSSNRLLSAQIEEINAKYNFWLKYKLVRYYKGESFIKE